MINWDCRKMQREPTALCTVRNVCPAQHPQTRTTTLKSPILLFAITFSCPIYHKGMRGKKHEGKAIQQGTAHST